MDRLGLPLSVLTGLLLGAVQSILAQPAVEWVHSYDLGRIERLMDIYASSDGNYVACGVTKGRWVTPDTTQDNILLKVDDAGRLIWTRTWGAVDRMDDANAVIETDDAEYLVVGRSDGNVLATLFDEDGALIWSRTYFAGTAQAVIELKNGSYVLCGGASGRAFLLCISRDGDPIWDDRFGEGTSDSFTSLKEAGEGIVASGRGYFANNQPIWRLLIAKTDFEGNTIWLNYHHPQENQYSYGMVTIPDGGGFVCGGQFWRGDGQSGQDHLWMVIDPDGEMVTWQRMDIVYDDETRSISRAFPTGYMLVGWDAARGDAQVTQPRALRLREDGTISWSEVYDLREYLEGVQQDVNYFMAVILGHDNSLIGAGMVTQDGFRGGKNGLLMKLEPEFIPPQFVEWTPRDTMFSVLPGDSVDFSVVVHGPDQLDIAYRWTLNDTLVSLDDSTTIRFDSLGVQRVVCQAYTDMYLIALTWRVTVTDLYISASQPDTLNLVLRRNSEVEFGVDVRYIGDLEAVSARWRLFDHSALEWNDVGGLERQIYLLFDRTGRYDLKVVVTDQVVHDSLLWRIDVRGVIRAYRPLRQAVDLEPDQQFAFELIPFNANNDSIEFWWTLGGEEDTLSISSILSISFDDTGRYVVSGYARERVSEEEWEEDVQRWVVNVHSLSAGLDPRLRGDDEGESEDDEEGSGDDDPLSLTIAPNPFNDQVTVTIDLGGKAFLPAQRADKNVRPPSAQVGGLMPVRIGLYAIDGREVLRLHDGPLSPGSHTFTLSHFHTFTLPSGIYFLRLQAGTKSLAVKAVMMR
ncbi:MAG: hypothetical protein FJY67_10275 [Calditrichaeota bacterium]|nr:hypothetical protein [Calditrichota bacterium]